MATPFELDRGTRQQRTDQGYELGHSDRLSAHLVAGDRHTVEQAFQMASGAALVRVRVRVHAPDVLPVGASWELSALLNGTVHYTRTIDFVGRVVELHPVLRLRGANAAPSTNLLVLRLRLV